MIDNEDLTTLIPQTIRDRLVARYCVNTEKIKRMHKRLQADAKYDNLPEVEYNKKIYGSSQSDKTVNCLTYCSKIMYKYLDINVPMKAHDMFPSTVVQNCINAIGVIKPEILDPSPNESKCTTI